MSEPIQKDAHIWARHPEDWYVEPEWCSRRLFEVEHFEGAIYDPACGCGRIVRSAIEAGYMAKGNDIVARAGGADPRHLADFRANNSRSDNIVSNPPFGIADAFAARALDLAIGKVALLLPTKWMNAAGPGRLAREDAARSGSPPEPAPVHAAGPGHRSGHQARQWHHRLRMVRLAARLPRPPRDPVPASRPGRSVMLNRAEAYLRDRRRIETRPTSPRRRPCRKPLPPPIPAIIAN